MQSEKKENSGRVYPGLYEASNGSVWLMSSSERGVCVYGVKGAYWGLGDYSSWDRGMTPYLTPYGGSITLRN